LGVLYPVVVQDNSPLVHNPLLADINGGVAEWLSSGGGRISKIYTKAPVLSSGGACLPAGRDPLRRRAGASGGKTGNNLK